jgi:predicted MFS family arabinose efflux permease
MLQAPPPDAAATRRVILVLGVAGFASTFGFRLIDPLIPDIAHDYGVSLATAATLATSYALTYAFAQPILGPVGDVIGKARLIRIGTALLAVALVATAFAPDFGVLSVVRALSGVAAGAIIPLAMAIIGDRVPIEGRQIAIGRFLFAILAAQLTGTIGAGLLATSLGWRGVMLVAAAVAAAAFGATVLGLKPRPVADRPPFALGSIVERYREVLANRRALPLCIIVATEGVLAMGPQPFVAAILRERSAVGALEAGFVIGGIGVGGLLYTLSVGALVRRLGTRRMVVMGGAAAGAALFAFGLGAPWQADVAAFVVLGFGFMMLHNTLQTIATELAPDARGSAIALFAFSFFVGQGFGPLGFGALLHALGTAAALTIFAIGLFLLGFATRAVLLDPRRF